MIELPDRGWTRFVQQICYDYACGKVKGVAAMEVGSMQTAVYAAASLVDVPPTEVFRMLRKELADVPYDAVWVEGNEAVGRVRKMLESYAAAAIQNTEPDKTLPETLVRRLVLTDGEAAGVWDELLNRVGRPDAWNRVVAEVQRNCPVLNYGDAVSIALRIVEKAQEERSD